MSSEVPHVTKWQYFCNLLVTLKLHFPYYRGIPETLTRGITETLTRGITETPYSGTTYRLSYLVGYAT